GCGPLERDLGRRLVAPAPGRPLGAQAAVARHLREADLSDELRAHPVDVPAREAGAVERRPVLLEGREARGQLVQRGVVEAGADLARVAETAALVVVADEQRAEADTPAVRLGVPADDERLPERRLALRVPVGRQP